MRILTTPSRRAAGAKLLKRNLSDIAAMGGRPGSAVLSLALAPATSVRWLREFYLGLAACARSHGVKIVGGDITQAPAGFFGAFLTLHGEATGPRVLTRTGARAGDTIFVTGRLGGSRLGHHYKFTPRLREGAWLAAQPEVMAMMDISDGIAKDIWALTPAGLIASINPADIPVSAAASRPRAVERPAGLGTRPGRWRGLRIAVCDPREKTNGRVRCPLGAYLQNAASSHRGALRPADATRTHRLELAAWLRTSTIGCAPAS